MKRILFIIFLSLFFISGYAQHEIGLLGGAGFYMGEINPKKLFYDAHPAYGLFFRYNFDGRIAARANLLRGVVSGSDSDGVSYTPSRGHTFTTTIYEVSVQAEYNFLDYEIGSEKYYFTPYLFGGVGGFAYLVEGENTQFSFAIPFGFGFKYSLFKNLECGLEWGFRKTFTDSLDGLVNYEGNVQVGNPEDNDWYSFALLFLSYRLNLGSSYKCIDYQKRPKY